MPEQSTNAAWIQVTLENGQKRLVNFDKFTFAFPDGEGSYLVADDNKNSIKVKESPHRLKELLGLKIAYEREDHYRFRNATA